MPAISSEPCSVTNSIELSPEKTMWLGSLPIGMRLTSLKPSAS